jgi:hypothetical protein
MLDVPCICSFVFSGFSLMFLYTLIILACWALTVLMLDVPYICSFVFSGFSLMFLYTLIILACWALTVLMLDVPYRARHGTAHQASK